MSQESDVGQGHGGLVVLRQWVLLGAIPVLGVPLGATPVLDAVGWMVGLDWCSVSYRLLTGKLGVSE